MVPPRRFEELEVWKGACALAAKVYKLTEKNERLNRDFGLKDQVRRAAVSIASNIAEGFERGSKREFIHFLYTIRLRAQRESCGPSSTFYGRSATSHRPNSRPRSRR